MADWVTLDALGQGNPGMTHQPEQQNPVPSAIMRTLAGINNFRTGGFQRALDLPNSWLGKVLQNPDNAVAMGVMSPLKGSGVRLGAPEAGDIRTASNDDLRFRDFERQRVLDKVLEAKDFKPSLQGGQMKFKSLTPDENYTINRIGWSRHPDVSFEQETDPFRSAGAWEKNLQYWRDLSTPSKE